MGVRVKMASLKITSRASQQWLNSSTIALVQSSSYSTDGSLTSLRKGTGGRSSFNGNVATVFGASGFLGRAVCNKMGKTGTQLFVPYRGDYYDVHPLKMCGDLGQVLYQPFQSEGRRFAEEGHEVLERGRQPDRPRVGDEKFHLRRYLRQRSSDDRPHRQRVRREETDPRFGTQRQRRSRTSDVEGRIGLAVGQMERRNGCEGRVSGGCDFPPFGHVRPGRPFPVSLRFLLASSMASCTSVAQGREDVQKPRLRLRCCPGHRQRIPRCRH